MKQVTLFFILIFFISCDKYPSNPPVDTAPTEFVFIEHVSTEYVSTEPPSDMLTATKVNVLSFKIRAERFTPSSLEVYGRALMEGPPESREHSIHFWTDSLVFNPVGTGYTFNTLQTVQPGSTYTLVRPKYPTNEYSPFQGNQGMVEELSITEIWAYDETGEKLSVNFEYAP